MKQTQYLSTYDRYKKSKRRKRIVAVIAIGISTIGIGTFEFLIHRNSNYESVLTPTNNETFAVEAVIKPSAELTDQITEPVTPVITPEVITPKPEVSVDGDEEYDFSQPVAETDPVDKSYFDDAVFIGNSRTQGFLLYSGLSNTTGYASRGLMVDTIFTDKVIKDGDKELTVFEALKANPGFNKVYIMLGMNELGWSYSYLFKDGYEKVIDQIREINSEAEIYIQSILPVTKKKSETDKIYNNTKVNEFNELIKEIAIEKQVYYVDSAQAVADENGYLPEDAAFDGIHLTKEYCVKWLSYLKTHTVTKKYLGKRNS